MFLKSVALRVVSVIALAMLLAGCAGAPTPLPTYTPQPTENIQPTLAFAQTQAVQNFVANLTKNAPTATAVPPTKAPTPLPSATLAPTVPPAPAATATNAPAAKPTAVPVYCTIKSVYPSESNTFSAGDNIKPVFVVINTGTTTWTTSGFTTAYWSGARFDGQVKLNMPENTNPGSDITLGLSPWTAPKTAGTYKAVWAVISGYTPYCLIPVTVVVK